MTPKQKGIILLLKSAITGEKYSLPPEFALEQTVKTVHSQGLTPMAFQGAQNCGVPLNHPVMQRWSLSCLKSLCHSERQALQVQALLEGLAEKGLDHMPVKGCNLKKLYPSQELRLMGDADILIRQEQYSQVGQVMEALGFQFCSENVHVWVWQGEDLHVELHKSLVPPSDKLYYAYYGSGWQLAKKGEGSRYDLSPEDTLVFLVTHFARHYRHAGIGCRHVVDLFVFRRAYPDIDLAYVEQQLEDLGLKVFFRNCMRLLEVWFADAQPNAAVDLMTEAIFSGGAWGSVEAKMRSKEVEKGKGKAPARRGLPLYILFPNRNFLSYRYGILLKYPVLLPVIWVVRWFDILLIRPQKIKKKLAILRDMDDDVINRHRQALLTVGLDLEE